MSIIIHMYVCHPSCVITYTMVTPVTPHRFPTVSQIPVPGDMNIELEINERIIIKTTFKGKSTV